MIIFYTKIIIIEQVSGATTGMVMTMGVINCYTKRFKIYIWCDCHYIQISQVSSAGGSMLITLYKKLLFS